MITVDAIRFLKRMTNIGALPGNDKINLGNRLIVRIVEEGIVSQLIECLKYGMESDQKKIIRETSKCLHNISSYGKCTLRYTT